VEGTVIIDNKKKEIRKKTENAVVMESNRC
jgi:hypothetical protein